MLEPRPSEPDPTGPGRVEKTTPLPTTGQPYRATVRRGYPKPPALWNRIALLILRPDQWAQAARYPFHITFFPLVVVIFLSALAIGLSAGSQTIPLIRSFAATYDQRHPPMVYENGTLRVEPVEGKELPRFVVNETPIIIDPTGKTTLDALENERAIVLGPDALTLRSSTAFSTKIPIRDLFDNFGIGPSMRIDSAHLQTWVSSHGVVLAISVGLSLGFLSAAMNFLWALLVAFLAMPIVLLGAPNLAMPRRVAYRIALAVTIPLIAVDGLMQAAGIGVSHVIGMENTPILWFAATACLAFWAGLIASRLYSARRTKRTRA